MILWIKQACDLRHSIVFWDIAGVKGSVSSGSVAIPEWNSEPVQKEGEVKNGETPWWVYASIASFVALIIVVYKYRASISEYLMSVWMGIMNSLETLWTYTNYLSGSLSLFIRDVLLPTVMDVLNSRAAEIAYERWGKLLCLLNPGLDEMVAEETLSSMFPEYIGYIHAVFRGVSIADFILDPNPLKKWNEIIHEF